MTRLNGMLTACLAVVALTTSTAADEPVHLQYQFVVGQTVRYAVSMRDEYEIQVAQAEDKPFTEQQSVKQYRVVSVNPDGSAVLEVQFESVKATVVSEGQTRTFDSAQKIVATEDAAAFGALSGIIGKPHVRVTAATNGQLSEVKLLVGDATQPEDVSKSALDAFVTLPGEPVTVGTAWREDFMVPVHVTEKLAKQIKVQRRYYLQSVDGDRATITFETKILSPISDPDEEIQLIRRPTKGTIVLDLRRGITLEKSVTLENTVSGFGGIASVMTLKQNHTEKLIEVQTAAAATVATPQ